MQTRTCNKCDHIGPLETDFPKNKAYAGGYRPQCKTCHNAAARQWQKDNPQKFAAIQNTYHEKHGTYIRKKQREKFQKDSVANAAKNERTKGWRARMKAEGKMAEISRRYKFVKYEMSPDEYDAKFKEQNGVCAICYLPDPQGIALAVDHDHETGENRGLLCGRCNKAIGLLHDDFDRILATAAYIQLWKTNPVSTKQTSYLCTTQYHRK